MSPDRERRLEEIFSAARNLPPRERAAFLVRACGSDAEMKHHADSLLAAHDQAGEFLQSPTIPLAVNSLVGIPGDRIGRYRLLEQIGEGGFGVVWMAEQEEPVRRRVALKIIKLGMDTREVVARFEAERQALAMMEHPNIARVFDGGATETGRPYFVMELVKGIPIADYCDANKLCTRARLELFLQVCQAVQHAHQKGVIHRDLKPSNILVTVQDDKPVPKVIDFGVAKATQARLTEETVFTQFRQWIGTPAYMSPEQAGLGSLDVDTRSDIYSLGVLLYELLTSRTPFDTQRLLEKGYDAVMQTIREEEPPKPSTRLSTLSKDELSAVASKRGAEPAMLNRLVHGDLDWIVMKALEKDRRRRYETPDALASDVARHLRSEPVSAAAPSAYYSFQKFVLRHRTGLATAIVLLLLLTSGAVVSTWQAVRATRAEARERVQRARAEQLRIAAETSLYRSRLSENRALRLARPPGWSEMTLANLSSNVAMNLPQRDLPGLRGEAVASLEELDVRLVTRLSGHRAAVWSLDFSPDSAILASADHNGVSRLWQIGTEEVIWEKQDGAASWGHIPRPGLAPYPAIRFNPAGNQFAHSTWTHAVEVINVSNPAAPILRIASAAQSQDVAFNRDGAIVAVAWSDCRAVVYDARTGDVIREIRPGENTVPAGRKPVAVSPDGTLLAAVGDSLAVQLYRLDGEHPPVVLGHHREPITSFCFAPGGGLLVSTSADHTAKVFDVVAGKELFTLAGHKARVHCAFFRRDGRVIATASDDQTVRLWDARLGQTIMVLRPEIGPALTVAFSPDGRQLAVASEDIVLYCLTNEGAKQVLFGHGYQVTSLAFHPTEPILASASGDNSIRLWNLASGETETRLPGHPSGQPHGLAFSPDGALLAAGHWGYSNYRPTNHAIRVWETARGTLHRTFAGHDIEAGCVAFDPSGKLLASGDNRGLIVVRDCVTGDSEQRWQHTNATVIGLQFLSPTQLIMAHRCGHLRLGDCRTGRISTQVQGATNLTSLAVSRSQSRLAVGSDGGTIQLFALPALSLLATLETGERNARTVTFSGDGRLLASGGANSQVILWDALRGVELLKLPPQESPIYDLAFEPVG